MPPHSIDDSARAADDLPKGSFLLNTPLRDELKLAPTNEYLREFFAGKYAQPAGFGSSPLLRLRHSFLAANDYYEAIVSALVRTETRWLDVGCGRDVFPSNYRGAKVLAERCAHFAGVDPDPNILENDLLAERFRGPIEDFATAERFDLVTMRMVAEHIVDAARTADKLAELTARSGLVVIFTPWKWSPMSLIASLVPFSMHNRLKRLIWDTEPQDTFPTAYRMNTRSDLRALFEPRGLREVFFCALDDCSIFTRFETLNAIEISARNACLRVGLPYLERCLLAVFRRD